MVKTFKVGTWTVTLTRKGAAWTWDVQSRRGGASGFRPNYELAKDAAEEFIALQSIALAEETERRSGC